MVTYPGRVKFVCLLVLGSAVLLELLQIFVPDRDARILDALEKLAGGIVGISFAYGIRNSSGLRR
jgi:VanZ family protein